MFKIINIINKKKEFPKLFSVIVDQGFMSVTTLLTTVVLARTYSKISYADLVLLFSVTLFILGFQSAIISKPYAINLNDFEDKERTPYFRFNLNLKLYFTVLLLLIFPIFYFVLYDTWNIQLVLVFTLYIITNTSYYFVRETLLSERKTKQNLGYGIACSLGLLTLLGCVYFFKKITVIGYLLTASFTYGILTLIYLIRCYKRHKGIKILNNKDYIALNWKVGKWLLGSNVLFFLSSSIYPWLLLYITKNKDDIAVFGVLMSVASIVNPLLSALSSYLLPLLVKNNSQLNNVNLMVRKWTLLFGVLSFFLLVIGYFFGQTIITILFGEKYIGLGVIVIYPFIVQGINVLFQPLRISLNAIKRTDINFIVLIPRSLIALTLGFFLIENYGLVGAFYTMLIENSVYQILNWIMFRNVMKSV